MVTNTQKHMANSTDINRIVQRFKKSGQLPNQELVQTLQYADVSEVPDFMTMKNQMIAAEAAFLSFPPEIRREFDHDPVKFLQFVANPENKEKARTLGLLKPQVEEKPDYAKLTLEELKKLNKGKEGAQ